MPGRAYETLFELASEQYGYVTREQAVALGFNKDTLAQMAQRGRVENVSHGLYRFKAFPPGPLDTYMESTLWPRGTRGVLSHETALDLYDLSDVNPAKVHITLPPGHRISREAPKLYALHFEPLEEDEVTYHEGIPITTVERSIRDCHREHLRRDLLRQAIEQARARGLITKAQEESLRTEVLSTPKGTAA